MFVFISVLTRQLRLRFGWAVALGMGLALAPLARGDEFDVLRTKWQNYLIARDGIPIGMAFRGSPSNLVVRANRAWSTMNTNASRTALWSGRSFGSNRSFGTNSMSNRSSGSNASGSMRNRRLGTNAASGVVTRSFSELETMALAWATPGCPLYGNTNLAAAVDDGMDWMVAHIYTPTANEYDNWWDWEIGGAQAFNNAFALMYPTLTSTQISNYCAALDGHLPGGPANMYGWQWSTAIADMGIVMIVRGILGKDAERIAAAQAKVSTIFPYVKTGAGFYSDGSFVMHNNKAYTGGYGLILLNALSDWINLMEGSKWQFTDEEKACVFNWVSNSYEPVIYNGAMMDMVRGREITRASSTEITNGMRTLAAIRQVARFAPPATAVAFSNFANAPLLPPGQFQFAGMDRVVALREGFGVGISMCSTRIANYESIHYENLHGWYTGEGMTYLYLGKVETQFTGGFWPTVDPYHLPGTTVEMISRSPGASQDAIIPGPGTAPPSTARGSSKTTSQHWVGGAQVSRTYGTAGMSLMDPVTPALTAKKSWFMFDNEVVCLGAGITCGDPADVNTTVEDRRLGTDPTNNFTVNGTVIAPAMGWSNNLSNVSWCALDGVGGYYFPGGAANLQAAFVSNSGSWSDVTGGRRRNPALSAFPSFSSFSFNGSYTEDYLKLWFNHGVNPSNATYAYVILPNMTASSTAAYAADPDIVVITNTPEVQAAKKPSLGVVAANFWTGGTHSVDLITANEPSSIITSHKSSDFAVGISDPTQTNSGSITVTLDQAATALVSADPGVTVERLSPKIVLSVDLNGSLGRTFQASFNMKPLAGR
jgi:hyaluronate lyase